MKLNGISVRNTQKVSFNGLWKVKGSEDALGDIAGYLLRKSRNFDNHFQFLRIRFQEPSASPLDRLLKQPDDISDKDFLMAMFSDCLTTKGKIAVVYLDEQPKRVVDDIVDLFVTNEDRIMVETRMAGILKDSSRTEKKDLHEIMDRYFKNKAQIDNGRPIRNFLMRALEEHTPIRFNRVTTYPQEEVIQKLSSQHFDFVNGVVV